MRYNILKRTTAFLLTILILFGSGMSSYAAESENIMNKPDPSGISLNEPETDVSETTAGTQEQETETAIEENVPEDKEQPDPDTEEPGEEVTKRPETKEVASEGDTEDQLEVSVTSVISEPGIQTRGYVGNIYGVNVWNAWDYYSFLSAWMEIHTQYGGVGHIQLTGDVYKHDLWTVSAGTSITIDLNGHTLYADPDLYYMIALNDMFLIENGGILKIYGGNIDGRGLCYWYDNGTTGGSGALINVHPGGTLILENCNIGNVTNREDYGESCGEAGGTIVNQFGSLYATNTCFHDCSGTAIWGESPISPIFGNGAGTYLTNCSSYNVSGLWDDGKSRGIAASLTVSGGTYHIGRSNHYTAGISSRNNSAIHLENMTMGGTVLVEQGASAYMDGCTLAGDLATLTDHNGNALVISTSSGSVVIKNSTLRSYLVGAAFCSASGNPENQLINCKIYNQYAFGVRVDGDCRVTLEGCDIHDTTDGISNARGTVQLRSGNVYSNTYGARNYGTFNMSGGSIYSNTYDGIRNAGTCNLYGGSVKNNQYGIRNGFSDDNKNKNGILIMSGGEISNNSIDGILNGFGTATVSGGTIKDNKCYGTNNQATMNYAGGISGGNSQYDIYQNGNYKMSGSASTYSNGVYLAKDRIIEITGPLTCADGAIKVTVNRTEAVVGRTIAQCLYGMNKDNADAMLNKFSLETKKTNTLGADGRSYRNAVLRSGTGTNGAVGNIILSEEYYVNFDGNVTNEHLTFALPQQQTVYWKEDVNVPTVGTIVYYDGRELKSLQNIGYTKKTDGSGGSCSVGQVMFYAADEITKDQTMYALYTSAADVNIDGNTQTAGDDYMIHGFVSNETVLPENTFEKVYRGTRYDENLEMDLPYKTEYSHHGWSYSDSAMYKDEGVGKCGEVFDLTAKIMEMLAAGQESVSEEGYINNITLYAVWDEPPKITAMNKYWNTDAIRAGKLNKEDLLRTASATDKEDGTDVKLEVEDIDIDDFLHFGEIGWMSVRYKATDGAGNVTYKLIKVEVVQAGIVQGEFYDPNPAYVRMIDRENYNKMNHEEGGLMEDSVWYTIPTYRKTMLDAFDRIDNGEAIIRYRFTCKDIREAQAFEEEAMRNGTYPTAAHWDAWQEKFEHCKVFDTGYRSSQVLNNSIYAGDYEDWVDPDEQE